jgi:hypothetical protein
LDVPIITVLLTIISNVLILAVTLYFQARREHTQFDRAQRVARLERVRTAYRLVLQGDQLLLDAAIAASALPNSDGLDDEDLYPEVPTASSREISEMYNRARTELTLENANLDAFDLTLEIFIEYARIRHHLTESPSEESAASPREWYERTNKLRAAIRKRREVIQAHLAELETPAQQQRSWRKSVKRLGMPWE